jgi:hypothetical protein
MKGPRIAIIGSCQVVGLGVALRGLLPESDVMWWHIGVSPASPEEIVAGLKTYDVVISQIADRSGQDTLSISRLREILSDIIYLPIFVFRGLQPDCIYLNTPTGLIKDGLGDMHSGIIAAAYVLGLPEAQVPKLFNALVFTSLGYFDSFSIAKTQTLKTFLDAGFDLKSCMASWLQNHGAFMHTVNHPKICVLARLAWMIAQKKCSADLNDSYLSTIEDPLEMGIQWPVYPELARRIGIAGSTTFIQSVRWAQSSTRSRELSLSSFVAHCYRRYETIPRDMLRSAVPAATLSGIEALLPNKM